MAGIEGVLGEAIDGVVGAVLQRCAGMERHGDAGELLDSFEEGWIEQGTELGERAQGGRMVWVVRGEHAGRGSGGVGECGIALEDQHAGAAGVELQGEREANDAGTGNEDIGYSLSGRGSIRCCM